MSATIWLRGGVDLEETNIGLRPENRSRWKFSLEDSFFSRATCNMYVIMSMGGDEHRTQAGEQVKMEVLSRRLFLLTGNQYDCNNVNAHKLLDISVMANK